MHLKPNDSGFRNVRFVLTENLNLTLNKIFRHRVAALIIGFGAFTQSVLLSIDYSPSLLILVQP